MTVFYRNPMSVIKVEEVGATDSGIVITNYDTNNGVITGSGFGATTGKVWLLDRDTHSYIEQAVSDWSDSSITLTDPIDLSEIQGNSCFFVETSDGKNSHKWMVYGDGTLTVPGHGLVYVKDVEGNITKYTATTSAQMGAITGGANQFGKDITIGTDTINTSQIVGIQFSSQTSFSMPANYLSGCMGLNQPVVLPNAITISTTATYFMRYDAQFDCPLIFGSNHQRIGNYFMSGCYAFNQPLDVSMFKYLTGTYFMQNCRSFNQELKLPTTLTTTSFNTYFMTGCSSFNKSITLPTNTSSLGNYFFNQCFAFNQPLDVSMVTTISTYFMYQCYAFNQPLTFRSNAGIGNNFMNNCYAFNSKLTLPTSMTSTPTNFMTNCYSFNQPISISNVTTIGNYFMSMCEAFNQPLDLGKVTSIGTYFLNNCWCYSHPITLRSQITSVGANFCVNNYTPHTIIANNSTSPTDANSLSANYTASGCYLVGHTIKGSGRSTWLTNLPNSTASPYRNLIDGEE